jgi:hypothetical protein
MYRPRTTAKSIFLLEVVDKRASPSPIETILIKQFLQLVCSWCRVFEDTQPSILANNYDFEATKYGTRRFATVRYDLCF